MVISFNRCGGMKARGGLQVYVSLCPNVDDGLGDDPGITMSRGGMNMDLQWLDRVKGRLGSRDS